MEFSSFFPIWSKLTPEQRQLLQEGAVLRQISKGTVIHNGSVDCTGLLLVGSYGPIFSPRRAGRLHSTACLSGICACFLHPV